MIWPSAHREELIGRPGYWVDDDSVVRVDRTTVFDPSWDVPVGLVHRQIEPNASVINRLRRRKP